MHLKCKIFRLIIRIAACFFIACIWYYFAEAQGTKDYPAILKKKGDQFLIKSEADSALYFYNKALLLMKDDRYRSDKAMLLTNVGNAYHYLGKVNVALDYSKRAFTLWSELHDTSGLARSGCDIGFYYFQLYKRTEAFEWLTKSLKYAEISKDRLALGKANNYLALLYTDIDENLNKALEYTTKAEAYFSELKNPVWINTVKNELAVIYQRMGKFDEAIKTGKELQAFCEQNNMVYEEGVVLHNLGYVYTRMKDYNTSIKYYNKAIEKFKIIGDSAWIASEYYSIGLDFIESNNYKEAIKILSDGLAIVSIRNDIEIESGIAKALEDVYEKSGNYEEALKFNKRYFLLRDSLNSKEQGEKLIELQTKFETEKKDKEIVLLNKDKQLQFAETYKQKQLKNIFIGGLCVLAAFLLLLLNRYTVKRRHAKILEDKNAQIKIEKERAEQNEKYKQEFLASMSHEIRTPLNAVIGLSKLLSRKKFDDQSTDYLNAINHSAKNLLLIVNDILDISKIEAGKMDLKLSRFDPGKTLKLIVDSFQPLAAEKHIKLKLHNLEPGKIVTGDEGKLTQVLTNLLGNAIKFTDSGEVILRVIEEGPVNNKVILKFNVEDTGIGISASEQENIFESFKQANTGESRKYGGTGLGLSISKRLIEIMGGHLSVVSEPGEGSVFSFSLSFWKAEGLGTTTVTASDKFELHVHRGAVKILLAEDNVYNRLVAVDTLSFYFPDSEIRIAVNGDEVLGMVDTYSPDLILMDIQMPVRDGFETTRSIRNSAQENIKHIPVVALTASVIRSDLDKCIEAGMNAYVAKPFEDAELIKAVLTFSGKKFDVEQLPDKERDSEQAGSLNYRELFNQLIPARLDIIEKALPKGDWKTIRETVHLMRPQLIFSGMKNDEALFESFDLMDGSNSFMEWTEKTKLFCCLVRKKAEELQQV